MSMSRKLLLLSITIMIIASFSSCIVMRNEHRHWWRHRTKIARYYHHRGHGHGNVTGGRRFWVRGRGY